MSLRLNAIRIQQGGTDIYITAMPAREFIDNSDIDIWSPTHREGYQRVVRTGDVRALSDFLSEGGILPTSVLVSVRGQITISRPPSSPIGSVEIVIPRNSMYVVDGQRRREGIIEMMARDSTFGNFPLSLCLFQSSETDLSKEMEHFYVVNKRQKSVPTDLAQQLLYEKYSLEGPRAFFDFLNRINARLNERLVGLAVNIVIQLRNHSPWRNLIRPANELRRTGLIPQRTMADSIGRFVLRHDPEFMQAYEELLRDPANNQNQQRLENRLSELASYLTDYWRALSRIFRDAFTGPLRHREEFSIQRSTGVYVFHRIFSGIYPPNTLPHGITPIGVRHHCRRRGFSLTVMEDVLSHMVQNATRASEFGRAVDADFWHKGKRGVRPRGDALGRATNQRDIGQLSGRLGRYLPPLP